MLLIVEQHSGMVLGQDMLMAEPSLTEMQGSIPLRLLYQLVKLSSMPSEIRVRSLLLSRLLQPLAAEIGFNVELVPDLPSLEPARKFLLQRFV